MNALVQLPLTELLPLCALDDDLFARTFFPKTVRQLSPGFHRDIDSLLLNPLARFTAIEVFRGGAKTSKLRIFTAKRISFGISHTILFVSNSQAHSVKSLEWLKRHVEYNRAWADAFQLRKGGKWSGEDIEIIHGIDEYPIRVIAAGITGQIRGINIDDFRPDLIVCDDPDNEETTATPEQRLKTSDLFFGALAKSLAPASEATDAKMVLLQTPLNKFDLVETCMNDPQWHGLRFGCFDEAGQSRWPARFPTEVLLADKQAHINRNQLSLWMREMECSIISKETASFQQEWLQYWEVLPEGMTVIIGIDPASSESPKADFFAIAVVGFYKGAIYILDYALAQKTMPDAACNSLFNFILKWKPRKIVSESVNYQRVFAWYVKREMEAKRVYVLVDDFDDRRKKSDRIVQALVGPGSHRKIYCRRDHIDFIQQFTEYSPSFTGHDDLIDAVAMAVIRSTAHMDSAALEGEWERIEDEERDIPDIENWRGAP